MRIPAWASFAVQSRMIALDHFVGGEFQSKTLLSSLFLKAVFSRGRRKKPKSTVCRKDPRTPLRKFVCQFWRHGAEVPISVVLCWAQKSGGGDNSKFF